MPRGAEVRAEHDVYCRARGAVCYLGPNHTFPVCDVHDPECEPRCEAIPHVLARAKQNGHMDIYRKALALGAELGCVHGHDTQRTSARIAAMRGTAPKSATPKAKVRLAMTRGKTRAKKKMVRFTLPKKDKVAPKKKATTKKNKSKKKPSTKNKRTTTSA